jgi:hypothetical protein
MGAVQLRVMRLAVSRTAWEWIFDKLGLSKTGGYQTNVANSCKQLQTIECNLLFAGVRSNNQAPITAKVIEERCTSPELMLRGTLTYSVPSVDDVMT